MTHHITKQVHEKLKIFTGQLAADKTVGKMTDDTRSRMKPLESRG
jgi:hypothetical protein